MSHPPSPARCWRQAVADLDSGLVAVVGVFVASRLIAHAAGLRFDAATLGGYFQYLDPQLLLRTDLVDAVWHLHVQPPLYNLLLGVALKAPTETRSGSCTDCTWVQGWSWRSRPTGCWDASEAAGTWRPSSHAY